MPRRARARIRPRHDRSSSRPWHHKEHHPHQHIYPFRYQSLHPHRHQYPHPPPSTPRLSPHKRPSPCTPTSLLLHHQNRRHSRTSCPIATWSARLSVLATAISPSFATFATATLSGRMYSGCRQHAYHPPQSHQPPRPSPHLPHPPPTYHSPPRNPQHHYHQQHHYRRSGDHRHSCCQHRSQPRLR